MTKITHLSPLALGLAMGIIRGVSILILGLLAHFFAYGDEFVSAMGQLYRGYDATIFGSILGGIIGLIDGFITGALIAWIYNLFGGWCKRSGKCD